MNNRLHDTLPALQTQLAAGTKPGFGLPALLKQPDKMLDGLKIAFPALVAGCLLTLVGTIATGQERLLPSQTRGAIDQNSHPAAGDSTPTATPPADSPALLFEVRHVKLREEVAAKFYEQVENNSWQIQASDADLPLNNCVATIPKESPLALARNASESTSYWPVPELANRGSGHNKYVVQPIPAVSAFVPNESLGALVNLIKGDSASNIVQAPTVRPLAGQVAVVQDATQRPFIVGAERVESKFGNQAVYQPIIEVFQEGIVLKLGGTLVDGNVDIAAHYSNSQIVEVNDYALPPGIDDGIQNLDLKTPKIELQSVSVRRTIPHGNSLLVDLGTETLAVPVEKKTLVRFNPLNRGPVFQQQTLRSMLIITPRKIDNTDPPQAVESPAAADGAAPAAAADLSSSESLPHLIESAQKVPVQRDRGPNPADNPERD